MKKIIVIGLMLGTLLLSSCSNDKSIAVIGGADGSTSVAASGNDNDVIHENEQVKVVKIDGSLYYDTGKDSELEARCGTLDGNLVKGAYKYEIPQNDGEANFSDAKGYQIGMTENTIEVPIDDDWEIFAKIDTNTDVSKYRYCYVLEGTLPNAVDDNRNTECTVSLFARYKSGLGTSKTGKGYRLYG